MAAQDKKCVLVIDGSLPAGTAANTAGILGITLGKHIAESVGPDVCDASGGMHLGIVTFPVPVLHATREKLREIRERLDQPDFAPLIAVDFSDVAQGCRTYDVFMEKAAQTPSDEFLYLGVGICGEKRLVNRLTGSLPLLR